MSSLNRILIVDDDPSMCNMLTMALSPLYEIVVAYDGFQALERLGEHRFSVAILDVSVPGLNGFEILEHIRDERLDTEVVMLTAHASLDSTIEALRLGACDYILKPSPLGIIHSTVAKAVEKYHLKTRLAAVHELSREIALSMDVGQVAQLILDVAKRELNFETCSLSLVDEEWDELRQLATPPSGEQISTSGRVQDQESEKAPSDDGSRRVITAVAYRGEPIYVPDVRQDARFMSVRATTRSELAVPLLVKGRAVGVLSVESAEPDAFSPDDIRLLSTLASQASVAVENARLYHAVKANYEYYQAVTDSMHDQVLIIDRDYRITDVNAVFLRESGCSREDVIGEICYDVFQQRQQPCDSVEGACPARQVWETGQPVRFTQMRYDRDGVARWLDIAASPLRDAKGQVTRVIEAHRDMTTERQLEERLTGVHLLGQELVLSRNKQQVAQVAVDAAIFLLQARLCGLWLVDPQEEKLVFQAHAGSAYLTDHYAALPQNKRSVVAAVARDGELVYMPDILSQAKDTAEPITMSIEPVTRSVLCAPLKMKGELIGVLNAESDRPDAFDEAACRLFSLLVDYSALALENAHLYEAEREQRRLLERSQSQLVQSEKLAATGRLAASLAHEINNPLQAIRNSLQLVLNFTLEPHEQEEYLHMANEEVERLTNVSARILDFARRPQREMQPRDLNAIVQKTLALTAKYLQHREVMLERDLAPDLPAVMASRGELQQVFLNLVLNALDAMPEGGTLSISTRLAQNGYVATTFADDGQGIPPEDLAHIFEPFFSTKEEGTGLGLSVSYNVVKRHKGEINVQSQMGEGSTFTVLLPILTGGSGT
jgi:PAS domain S-box-containing protein